MGTGSQWGGRGSQTSRARALQVLRDLVEPLKTAIQEYRDATGESELGGEGVTSLRAMSSKRLFACGDPARAARARIRGVSGLPASRRLGARGFEGLST